MTKIPLLMMASYLLIGVALSRTKIPFKINNILILFGFFVFFHLALYLLLKFRPGLYALPV